MDLLPYFQLAQRYPTLDKSAYAHQASLRLMTNFTDGVLAKLLIGMCLSEGIYPTLETVPYKQYALALKDPSGTLYQQEALLTFVWFETNAYKANEFTQDPAHALEVSGDLERCLAHGKTALVVQSMLPPWHTTSIQRGEPSQLEQTVSAYNQELERLARASSSFKWVDTQRVAAGLGFSHAYQLRDLYAFDLPFTHDFMAAVCAEWAALLKARLGLTKKVIVLDLDNTLWGGVVGEVGASGIELGPEYPGNAYQQFQRVLLEYYERGVVLAINSRNNAEDVHEVFEKNPHMLLQEKHFAAMRLHWGSKADALREIAAELNLGLDSFVFLDDDAAQRAMTRAALPEVTIPEFSLAPEAYSATLLSLRDFYQWQQTDEDRERGRMYAEERQRRVVQAAAPDPETYLAGLNIRLRILADPQPILPRISQLTLKTNQFNLTTKRYTETEVKTFLDQAGVAFAGEVRDRFGTYGITNLALIKMVDATTAELDTYLMSCRVMGRQVEWAFLQEILRRLAARGVTCLVLRYRPTAKNKPAKEFLSGFGATAAATSDDGSLEYHLEGQAAEEFLKKSYACVQVE